jgi:hypothetical protein
MFCTHCGAELKTNSNFCTTCGTERPGEGQAASPVKFNLAKFSKYAALFQIIPLGLSVLLTVLSSNKELGKVVGNFILSLEAILSTLFMMGGVIVGIIFFIKASGADNLEKQKDKQLGSLFLFGPFIWLFVIIFTYIIINILYQLLVR